jgi:STE24 endopeptidase
MDWFTPKGFAVFTGALVLVRGLAEWCLDQMNLTHVQAHLGKLPSGWKSVMDESTFSRSLDYTLAKGKYSQYFGIYGTLILLAILFSGFLPSIEHKWTTHFGESIWMQSGFLCFVVTFLALLDLPWNFWSQFYLEDRFGFNKSTRKLWVIDQVKMFILGWVIGWPMITLLLWIVAKAGDQWWIWAWCVLLVFQMVMLILAPMLILPLFNKLTPLDEGSLKDRLMQLAERTGFGMSAIQVMDGSRRSGHSNAFFTGFGKFRRIVLFDTLIEQLDEAEVEGVLAHEIGHFKKRHVLLMMGMGLAGMLIQFWILAWIAKQSWFFSAFGFEQTSMPIAFMIFFLILGTITFWISPLSHLLSRKFEYQADAYAAQATGNQEALTGALRKISLENLSNPVPHPLYSFVYYSHPTLLEREQALSNHIDNEA